MCGAYQAYAPSCVAQRFEEYETVLAFYYEFAVTLLSGLHGMTQVGDCRIRLKHGLGEYGLVEQLGGIGMYKECSALTYHDGVGVGVWLYGRYGL